MTGVAPGETYDVGVMGVVNGCSTLPAATLPVTVVDGRCLGAQSSARLDTSDQTVIFDSTTSSIAVAIIFDEPYALQESDIMVTSTTAGAMGVVVPGSVRRTGPIDAPGRSLVFSLGNVIIGESYTITISDGSDSCGTLLTGGSFDVRVSSVPQSGGVCPMPALTQNFAAPDMCGVSSNGSFATAVATGFTLSAPGDAFSISSTYDSSIGDNDYFSFNVLEPGNLITDLRLTLAYGCSFTVPPAETTTPVVDLRGPNGNTLLHR